MNLNLPNLSRREFRVRTVTGLSKKQGEFSSREREERVSALRICGAQTSKTSLRQQKLVYRDSQTYDRGLILGAGPQIGGAQESQKIAATCYAKDVRCSTEGQGQTQTVKNETILTNKVPLQSRQKSPQLDNGGGGLPPRDGDGGGGGGGGGGGWGGGGFVFWALILLVGFLRDRELDKPYTGLKSPKKKLKRRQLT